DRLWLWRVPGTLWVIPLNRTGLARAGLMCLQLLTVLLASTVVRRTGSGRDLIDGLHTLGLPKLFVHTFDQTLALYSGPHPDQGGQRRRARAATSEAGSSSPGLRAVLGQLARGDISFFLRSLQSSFDRARVQVASQARDGMDERLAHDVAVITGVA